MEANQVAVQDAQKELVSHRQNSVDLAGREWGVQKEADLDVLFARTDLLAQHLRQEHQVIVMYPDQITITYFLRHRLCEQSIGFLVGLPGGFVKGDFTRMVVEQRPQDRI